MPADYMSAAQALSLSPNPSSPTIRPPWSSPRPTPHRRLTSLASIPRQPKPLGRQILDAAKYTAQTVLKAFLLLTPLQRFFALIVLLASTTLGILFLIYSHAIFAALGPVAKGWRALPAGWLIVWLMTFCTAFPPMIGYSTATTVAGFVYGFPLGWPIVASASTAGSLVAFVTSRTVFSGYVHRLVGKDHRFVALGQVLRRDGLGVLTMIRFCPLPFSLSNGFLATIPSIRPWAFGVSTALASPKLLVHVFIGSRLALLAEEGDSMSTRDKIINYLSMFISAVIGITVGWLIYRRTMARAAEIALETAAEEGSAGIPRRSGEGLYDDDDADSDARLMDPEDAAAIMVDDDISLWEAGGEYRDEERTGLGIFSDGDGHGSKAGNGSRSASSSRSVSANGRKQNGRD